MPDAKEIVLIEIDWPHVEAFSVEDSVIHIATKDGIFDFKYPTPKEAKRALGKWLSGQTKRGK